jgi:hypothetical protein
MRETEKAVIVEIRYDRPASPAESVMDYLENHSEITNRTARELTGITSENTMKEVFLRLAKRDLIERIPDRKARRRHGARSPLAQARCCRERRYLAPGLQSRTSAFE